MPLPNQKPYPSSSHSRYQYTTFPEPVSSPPERSERSLSPRPLHRVLSLPLKQPSPFQNILARFELGSLSSASSISSQDHLPPSRRVQKTPKDFPRFRETTVAELVEFFDEGAAGDGSLGLRSPGGSIPGSISPSRRRLVTSEIYARNFEKWKQLERERFLESLERLRKSRERVEDGGVNLHRRASTALAGHPRSMMERNNSLQQQQEGYYSDATLGGKRLKGTGESPFAKGRTFSFTPAYKPPQPSTTITRELAHPVPSAAGSSLQSDPIISHDDQYKEHSLRRRPSLPITKGYKALHLRHDYPLPHSSSVRFSDEPSSSDPEPAQGRRSKHHKAKYILDMDSPRAWKFPRNIVVLRKRSPVPPDSANGGSSESTSLAAGGEEWGPFLDASRAGSGRAVYVDRGEVVEGEDDLGLVSVREGRKVSSRPRYGRSRSSSSRPPVPIYASEESNVSVEKASSGGIRSPGYGSAVQSALDAIESRRLINTTPDFTSPPRSYAAANTPTSPPPDISISRPVSSDLYPSSYRSSLQSPRTNDRPSTTKQFHSPASSSLNLTSPRANDVNNSIYKNTKNNSSSLIFPMQDTTIIGSNPSTSNGIVSDTFRRFRGTTSASPLADRTSHGQGKNANTVLLGQNRH